MNNNRDVPTEPTLESTAAESMAAQSQYDTEQSPEQSALESTESADVDQSPEDNPPSYWWTVIYPDEVNNFWLNCAHRGVTEVEIDEDTQPPSTPLYADPQQRYRRYQAGLPEDQPQFVEDMTPDWPTAIAPVLESLSQWGHELDPSEPEQIIKQFQCYVPEFSPLGVAYLTLHLLMPETIPELHDIWTDNHSIDKLTGKCQGVALGFDPQAQPLSQLWRDETIPDQAIFRWLEDMLEIWQGLEPWGCSASLIIEDNICVRSDRTLYLRQLSFDPISDPTPEFVEQVIGVRRIVPEQQLPLVKAWQKLFELTTPRRQTSFSPLLACLASQPVTSILELQNLLDDLAETLQSDLLLSLDTEIGEDMGARDTNEIIDERDEIDGGDGADIEDDTGDISPDEEDMGILTMDELEDATAADDAPTAVLPKQVVCLEVFGHTDTGRERHHNEDFFLIHNRQKQWFTSSGQQVQAEGLYIVCDGMGGHAEGEVASSLAAKTLCDYFEEFWPWQSPLPDATLFREGILRANQAIFSVNEDKSKTGSGRMGTTLIAALVQGSMIRIGHVGDSRVYRFSKRLGLEQITVDHEVGQRFIQQGVEPEIAYGRPDAYQLTQALGPRNSNALSPDVYDIEVHEDTLLLLCSDGLTDNRCLESHVVSHILPMLDFKADLRQGVYQLVQLGNEFNGHDNLTVIAARMKLRSQLNYLF
ncbi:serine/threonine phosphatase [Candidatus Synechococcus calcipolaris G9]|uniref:Serine/threonine phosphatase n=1 Tax=Candidatus Synechococcus calcipolaris G9 TaxID=1497997 RepID=A0ABT6EV77_9SYNE|nr:serine/threonine phosphatase [Candidatus Synechococcus calcipolaris]MDG2989727.1 serine/threonine phosphatase [Candidatus Synechococcus calcipolaris G9]